MIGSIVKRNYGYSFVYYVEKSDGTRKQKWISGFKTKKEAEKFQRDFSKKYKHDTVVFEEITLREYLDNWFEISCKRKGLAQNTLNGYKVNIKHICNSIGNCLIENITANVLDKLFIDLENKGLSGTSQLYVYRTLHKAFEAGVKRHEIPFNYCNMIDPPKKNKTEMKCIVGENFNKYIFHLQNADIRYSLPILFALCMGLRRGEVLGLSWLDINFEKKTLNVRRTATPSKNGYVFSDCKTEKSIRKLIIPDIIFPYILQWKNIQNSFDIDNQNQYVFMQKNNKILCASTLNSHFKKSLKECELDDMRFHDLRHSFATYLVTKGVPINAISQILGHSKISTTFDIYTHTDFEMQKVAFDCINNAVVTD